VDEVSTLTRKRTIKNLTPKSFKNAVIVELIQMNGGNSWRTPNGRVISELEKSGKYYFKISKYKNVTKPLKNEIGATILLSNGVATVEERFVKVFKPKKSLIRK